MASVGPLNQTRKFAVHGFDVHITTAQCDDDDIRTINVTISFLKDQHCVFRDRFIISHKSERALRELVNMLCGSFSAKAVSNGFISYNEGAESFSYNLDANDVSISTPIVPVYRIVKLDRSQYPTKQEAIVW